MTPACRAWTAAFAEQMRGRAALARRTACGRRVNDTIAECLELVVADLERRLAVAPPPVDDDPISWRSPVFNGAGRFDPFAGTRRDRLLASADVCRRLGVPEAARGYEQAAEQLIEGQPTTFRARMEQRARELTTPDAVPFTAGPQLGLFG